MTLEQQEQVEDSSLHLEELDGSTNKARDKPMIHSPTDPPQCEACQKLDLSFFDPNCNGCMQLLYEPSTSISRIFAVLRQWTPRTQQILETLVTEILKRGAHVNDHDGLTDMTLLHYASKAAANGMGDVQEACRVVNFLLAHGADPYIRCRWTNMAAIHYATYFNIGPVLKILLDATDGIDVDSPCSEFEKGTPLHIACTHLCADAAKVLLQYSASICDKDDLGRTPLECIPSNCDGKEKQAATTLVKLLQDAEPAPPLPPSYDDVGSKVMLQALGLEIGDQVIVGGVKSGVLRFCGPTEFAPGVWAGIELDEPAGKNDGSIQGISYFTCSPMHGIFAPISKISRPGTVMSTPRSERTGTPAKGSPDYGKVDTSRVTAKVDTGLNKSSSKSFHATDPGGLEVGDRAIIAGQRKGIICFSGETKFAPGWWYGIELDQPVGKNDGSVNGERYFTCKPKHGVFAPPSRVARTDDLTASRESLDSANADKQRRLSVGSGGLPSIYTTPSRSIKQNRPRSSGTLGLMRRGSSTSSITGKDDFKLQEGLSVFCNNINELGIVRYVGPTEFAEGIWVGVELRSPKGKNDGSVHEKRYFACKPNHGLIVRPSKVTVRGISGAKLLDAEYFSQPPE